MKNIFSAHLRSSQESVIKSKLLKFSPLLTAKCFTELYSGVKQHVIDQLEMSDSIMNEMKSIWSRARPYRPLTDLASDFRRLKKLRMKHPTCTLQDIHNIFAVRNDVEEFLDKSNVPVEVIDEASKRIGADKYGASLNFAHIIDETNLSEEESVPAENSEISNNDTVDSVVNTDLPVDTTDTVNTVDTTDNQDNSSDTPDNTELSKKEIAKLHRAIKKALKNKLSK